MLTSAAVTRAVPLLEARLVELEERVRQGEEAAWEAYLATLTALLTVTARTVPGAAGELLTTAQMAERVGLSPKTLLRRKATGQLKPIQLGKRGRGAVRWRGDEVAR
jgi:hypothetical protein